MSETLLIMEWIHLGLAGLTGICMGSFCSVLVYRIPLGKSVVVGRSRCCHCANVLSVYELIPVVSFLLQRARCRVCKYPISWAYPIREILLGIVCLLLFNMLGWSLEFMKFSLLTFLLLSISEIDFLHGIVPNQLVYAGTFLGSLLAISEGLDALLSALLASTTSFGLLMILRQLSRLLFGRIGLGMGDVKLISMIAFFIGWHSMWAFYLATLMGGFAGLYGLATGRFCRTTRIPFAPFITLGVIGSSFIYPLDMLSWFL